MNRYLCFVLIFITICSLTQMSYGAKEKRLIENFLKRQEKLGACFQSPYVCAKKASTSSNSKCHFVLRKSCKQSASTRRRRAVRDWYLTANELRDEPLPRSMKFYDTSGDEQITLREFSGALGHSPTEKHVQMAFTMADSDGNGHIDYEEFRSSQTLVLADDDKDDPDSDDSDDSENDEDESDSDESQEEKQHDKHRPTEHTDPTRTSPTPTTPLTSTAILQNQGQQQLPSPGNNKAPSGDKLAHALSSGRGSSITLAAKSLEPLKRQTVPLGKDKMIPSTQTTVVGDHVALAAHPSTYVANTLIDKVAASLRMNNSIGVLLAATTTPLLTSGISPVLNSNPHKLTSGVIASNATPTNPPVSVAHALNKTHSASTLFPTTEQHSVTKKPLP